jgi:branched-chain amino acid transport system ATP-binding protein
MAEAALATTAHAGAVAPLLAVRDLQAWYGESHVLHGVNFNVRAGEVVTLLGRNGAGKTTTLKAVMGILPKRTGSVVFQGKELMHAPARYVAREGIAFCMSVEQIFELFPNLKERLSSQGTKLSGGEQQMLAIGRILRTGAKMLLLDEPTEGLAPVIIQQIGRTIARLKSEGFTIVLVEQNFRFASTVADRHYVVEQGRVVDEIANSELEANLEKLHAYLGV